MRSDTVLTFCSEVREVTVGMVGYVSFHTSPVGYPVEHVNTGFHILSSRHGRRPIPGMRSFPASHASCFHDCVGLR